MITRRDRPAYPCTRSGCSVRVDDPGVYCCTSCWAEDDGHSRNCGWWDEAER